MDKVSQERLDEILSKDPEELNEDQKSFLRARRGYLKKSQLEEYKSVINDSPKEQTPLESYTELLEQAKSLGYVGKRLKRRELEAFIKERANNPFIR